MESGLPVMYNMVVSVMAALKSQPEAAYALQLDTVNVDACEEAEASYNVSFTDSDPCDATTTWALVPVDESGAYNSEREGSALMYGDLLALVAVAPASDDLADITSPPAGDDSTDLADSATYETSDVAFLEVCGVDEAGFQYDAAFGCRVRSVIPNNNGGTGILSGTQRDGANLTGVWMVMPVDDSIELGTEVTFNSGFLLSSMYSPDTDYETQYLTLGTEDEEDTLVAGDYADVGVFTGTQPLTYFNFVAPCTEFTMNMEQAATESDTKSNTKSDAKSNTTSNTTTSNTSTRRSTTTSARATTTAVSTTSPAAAGNINIENKTTFLEPTTVNIIVGCFLGLLLVAFIVLFVLSYHRVLNKTLTEKQIQQICTKA